MALARWLVFFPARLLDILVVALQALYAVYFWFAVKGKHGQSLQLNPKTSYKDLIEKGKVDPIDAYGFVRPEGHCLLQQAGSGLLRPELREKLLEQVLYSNGTLFRSFPNDEHWVGISGDAMSSWTFAYVLWDIKRPDLVRSLAENYLTNCFGLWWNGGNGISARCSNGGFSFVVDGWPVGRPSWKHKWGFMQPITGPGYFSGASLMALAAKELGGIWRVLYHFHRIMLGGPVFELIPVLYTKKELWYYAHEITATNLWVLNKLRGGFKHALRWTAEYIAPSGNAQPMVTGLAYDAGAVSKDFRDKALATLETIENPHYWPQIAPLDQNYFTAAADAINYSMSALAAILLTRRDSAK